MESRTHARRLAARLDDKRGDNNSYGPREPHFSRKTYIQQDICSAPLPFADKSVDFIVCSHTLEDIRDPVFVCKEMVRVAKRGYLECPSRTVESSMSPVRPNVIGSPHHRWFVEIDGNVVTFMHKSGIIYAEKHHLPQKFGNALRPGLRVVGLFWEGSFEFAERFFLNGSFSENQLEFVERVGGEKD